jgi:acetyl esterase/lipase
VERNVIYTDDSGPALGMDLYYPVAQRAPARLILFVHGGGFTSGDKSFVNGMLELRAILDRGYVVASVNYRLAPRYPFPAAVQDVRHAVRHLRANARRYAIDPDWIGAWGLSAGGNLVSLLGVTGHEDELDDDNRDDNRYEGVSSRVQAVVDMFGPTDFRLLATTGLFDSYLNSPNAGREQLLARASPVTYVTRDAAPFLIMHGDRDTVVPLEQSRLLYERLTAAGARAQLVVVRNAEHGFEPVGIMVPRPPGIARIVADFFDRQLDTTLARPVAN